jgi:hypothetical protein
MFDRDFYSGRQTQDYQKNHNGTVVLLLPGSFDFALISKVSMPILLCELA